MRDGDDPKQVESAMLWFDASDAADETREPFAWPAWPRKIEVDLIVHSDYGKVLGDMLAWSEQGHGLFSHG
jgi:hypothetical protein